MTRQSERHTSRCPKCSIAQPWRIGRHRGIIPLSAFRRRCRRRLWRFCHGDQSKAEQAAILYVEREV
jgi:hypothetical protein